MRNRILIVVLGISLGLGARFGVDLYERWKTPPDSSPAIPPAAKPQNPSEQKQPLVNSAKPTSAAR